MFFYIIHFVLPGCERYLSKRNVRTMFYGTLSYLTLYMALHSNLAESYPGVSFVRMWYWWLCAADVVLTLVLYKIYCHEAAVAKTVQVRTPQVSAPVSSPPTIPPTPPAIQTPIGVDDDVDIAEYEPVNRSENEESIIDEENGAVDFIEEEDEGSRWTPVSSYQS
jgi:hypothetical protein